METVKIILQILSVISGMYIAFSQKKKNILLVMFSFNILHLILLVSIREYSTVYSLLLINTRSVIYLFQDKLKGYKWSHIIPVSICICHLIFGFLSIEYWYQVLTVIAPIIMTLSLWYEEQIQRIRIFGLFSEVLWLSYNLYIGFYILCISRIILIASYIVSICKDAKKLQKNIA